MNKNIINKFWIVIKNNHWKILLTNTFYYLGFLLFFGIFLLFSTNLIEKIGPLLKFYVDIAQPMYQATGMVDPSTLTQIFLFSDMIHLIMNKLILFFVIFIMTFSILRGIKDWLLLGKKQSVYVHMLVVFGITTFLTAFSIITLLKINESLGFVIIPLLFLILVKYSLLLTQGILVNKQFSKKFLWLLLQQLISWLVLIIITLIFYYLISLIFSFVVFILAILIFIVFFILVVLREQYLLSYLTVNKDE